MFSIISSWLWFVFKTVWVQVVFEPQERMEWERMRLLAAITIQPHCKKKMTPERLLPLPWDRDAQKNNPPKRRVDSTRERMMEVYRRSKEKK
jgi:hypothetical protein